MIVHFSNRVEELANFLKKDLFSQSPFAQRFIAVPNLALKSWLNKEIVTAFNISMGVEMLFLDQLIEKLCLLLNLPLPCKDTLPLALQIEAKLRSQEDSSKQNRQLFKLAHQLAVLFKHYGIYGDELWSKSEGWQQQLWSDLQNHWNPAFKSLSTKKTVTPNRTDVEVHIFAISFLPKLYLNFLEQLSHHFSVNLYLLSPCQMFWSDQLTDFEKNVLIKRQRKNSSKKALKGYFEGENPLLSNWGRLGRKMAEWVEESSAQTEERYVLASNLPVYDSWKSTDLVIKPEEENSLLHALQADLLFMRPSQDMLELSDQTSIQLHAAPNRHREVEVLYNVLMNSIETRSLYQSQILVLAPNIEEYESYLRLVFESPHSKLKPQFLEGTDLSSNSYITAFLDLLALSEKRWNRSAISKLLENPCFMKKMQLNQIDLLTINDWIQKTDVRWGFDATHRNELLLKNHCRYGMIEESNQGTWENSFEILLKGLVSEEGHFDPNLGTLLGEWIFVLRSLHNDLKAFEENTPHSFAFWINKLEKLANDFLAPTEEEKKELTDVLHRLKIAGETVAEELFPFSSVKKHVIEQLKFSKRPTEHLQDSVLFCSMLPMRAMPAEVIVLLGMEEGAYPRLEANNPLNLLARSNQYIPSQSDYDRFLFLETLLSARSQFIILYTDRDESDGKTQEPSTLVQELFNYLDSNFRIYQQLPSKALYKQHPLHGFDADPSFKNYSESVYNDAKAFYRLLPENTLEHEVASAPPPKSSVSVQELVDFARNPLKVHFNHTLGMFLNNSEKRFVPTEEDFQLSALQKYIIKKDALKLPVETILTSSKKSGLLPIGPFKPIALQQLELEISTLHASLNQLDLSPNDIFSLDLQEYPLTSLCKFGEIHITAAIHSISKEGFLLFAKDEKIDLLRHWPQFLILCTLIETYGLDIKPQIVLLKENTYKIKTPFFNHPGTLLSQYLDYYFLAVQNASPLIPEWIPTFLNSKEEHLKSALEDTLNNPFKPMYNEYASWALKIPDLAMWKPHACELFSELSTHWFPKKRRTGVDNETV